MGRRTRCRPPATRTADSFAAAAEIAATLGTNVSRSSVTRSGGGPRKNGVQFRNLGHRQPGGLLGSGAESGVQKNVCGALDVATEQCGSRVGVVGEGGVQDGAVLSGDIAAGVVFRDR